MTKDDIKRLFGTYNRAGRAAGTTGRNVANWPDPVKPQHTCMLIGGAIRVGLIKTMEEAQQYLSGLDASDIG